MHADERSGERRRSETPNHAGRRVDRRNGAERRCNNEAWPESPSQLDKLATASRSSLLRTLLLSLLLATLVFAWLVEVGR